MAAPSFFNAGTGVTDAGGAWSLAYANPTAGVLIVQILQDGSTDGAVAVTGQSGVTSITGVASTWTQIVGANGDGSFPIGASGEARQFLYIARYEGSNISAALSGTNSTSEDLYARYYHFTDVSTGSTLATVIENATAGSTVNSTGSSATASDASVQTLGPDRLALNFVAVNDDNAIAQFSGETGGDWTLATAPYADAGGTDGAIALQIARPFGIYQGNILSSGYGIGSLTSNQQVAQSFVATGAVTSILANLQKFASPTDDISFEIQTDNAGAPSGTRVGSAATMAASDVVAEAWYEFTLNAACSASATYWIVASRSGSLDSTNWIRWNNSGSNVYADGVPSEYNGSSWSNSAGDTRFAVQFTAGQTIDGGTGSIVDIDAWGVVGFALIGTTVVTPPAALVLEHGFVNFNDPGVL